MPKSKPNLADIFILLNKFTNRVRELHQYPDLPEDEKKQIRAAIKIMKIQIEELFSTIGSDHEDAVRRI